jgi:hypothetical protein
VKLRRWLPIIAFAAFGAGAIACAAGEDLNPQPLPPNSGGEDGDKQKTTDSPEDQGGGSSGSTNTSSSGGSSSGFGGDPSASPSDAGTTADANDT